MGETIGIQEASANNWEIHKAMVKRFVGTIMASHFSYSCCKCECRSTVVFEVLQVFLEKLNTWGHSELLKTILKSFFRCFSVANIFQMVSVPIWHRVPNLTLDFLQKIFIVTNGEQNLCIGIVMEVGFNCHFKLPLISTLSLEREEGMLIYLCNTF